MLRTWLVGLGAGMFLAAGLAVAGQAGDPALEYPECNRTATAADLEGAKGAHKAATQFYERADYDRAIQYWKDAYQLDCSAHGVLINIANAYEKKGDRAEAVTALETYLARTPDASEAQTFRDKIQNLKNSIRPAPTPTASESASAPVPPPLLPTASAVPSRTVEAPPPEPPYGYAPWAVTGAGAVTLLVGGILTTSGFADIAEAEERCPSRKDCTADVADQGNQGRTRATIGGVLVGLGAAGVASGLIWQLGFNHPQPPSSALGSGPALRLIPVAGPGVAGVGAAGRF
ncbi:tetratricopeptide repeat protein [Sorangium cellulosum]|uniref:tetratricopeptide repeat protein n=1 Tax=Sorangium cellulosum TaxID=56 RepID=UPI001F179D7A|nr:tetratricopeptide repeat protein [Sorangium cellulosum]